MVNLVTYKLKYTCKEEDKNIIFDYLKNYNNLLKCTYNYMKKQEKCSTKKITQYQKSLNNIFVDSHFKNSAIFDAESWINKKKQEKICFGGKLLYTKYNHGLVSKEELREQRLLPIYSVGEATKNGNRKFTLLDKQTILFKPTKQIHINLNLKNYKNRIKDLQKLIELQQQKALPITYKLDLNYVYLTFDLNKIRGSEKQKCKENRVFAIDLNPNYVGYCIVDWKNENKYKIIDKGVISIKDINDYDNALKGKHLSVESKERKQISHKRNYEVIHIAKQLVKIAKHYRCEIFAMEDLNIVSKDKEKGKRFNRLCNNQWCRNRLTQIIEKECNLVSLKIVKINCAYSSFIGNLVYQNENLPDMILSSIEIGRRGYEFNCQYIKKCKNKKKNIIFPDLHVVKDRIVHALEVLDYTETWTDLLELYCSLKNLKLKYRVSLENCFSKVFSLFSIKSKIKWYNFI